MNKAERAIDRFIAFWGRIAVSLGLWLYHWGKAYLPLDKRIQVAQGDDLTRLGHYLGCERETDVEFRERCNRTARGEVNRIYEEHFDDAG